MCNKMIVLPFVLWLNVEGSDHDCGHLKPSDGESERLRPIRLDDFAVSDGEVVEGVGQVGVQAGLVLEAQELAVVFQDEEAGPPIPEMFPCKSEK